MKRRSAIVLGALFLAGVAVALLPPSTKFDPAPLFSNMAASIAAPAPGPLHRPGSLVLRNVRIVGEQTDAPTCIRIDAGRITRIGVDAGVGAKELPELDGGGRYLVPGLIDAHVHLSMAPGSILRGDDAATCARLRAWHMRAYLASGVTSVLDAAVDDRISLDIAAHLQAGHPGPRYFTLGPPLAARGGYVAALFPPGIDEPGGVGPHLDRLVAMHADGVKVPLERGMLFDIWNIHSPKILDEIRRGAEARHLPIYVHAMNEEMFRLGLTLSPHAFMHRPETISDVTLQALVAAHPFVVSTAAVFDVERTLLDPTSWGTPHDHLTIPPIERATLNDPDAQHRFIVSMIEVLAPFVPGRFRDLFASIALSSLLRKSGASYLARNNAIASRSLLRMHHAGVPIVLGSDAGNWPLFPYYFHGPTTWREVAVLERAGFTPAEVLQAATRNAARMLGVENELGSVAVGKRADLLLLSADPRSGLADALPTLQTVILDGIAHTPEQWMHL